MPRSDKPISTGSLSDPVSSARGRTWVAHASPEDSDQYEPDGLLAVDQMTHETVEAEIDIVDPDAPKVTVRPKESTPLPLEPTPVYEWSSARSVNGRSYSRSDKRVAVDTE